jgi:hypothetical protein
MGWQTLRDWVHHYNEEGLAGLSDRQGAFGPKRLLSAEQAAEVAAWVRTGPDQTKHSVVRWRRADLARKIKAKFGIVLAERTMSTVLRVPFCAGSAFGAWSLDRAIPAMTLRRKRLSEQLRRPHRGRATRARQGQHSSYVGKIRPASGNKAP